MDEEKARAIAENSDMVVTNRVAYAKFAYTTRHGAIAGKSSSIVWTQRKTTSSRSRAA